MTEPSIMGRRAQNRLVRLELNEARSHGIAQRHALKLRRLRAAVGESCQCEVQSVHRHACSYDDVICLLSASIPEPGGPKPPP
ncbi:hypothetical protein GCM10017788_52480 [Amycolatopsis acidiphila]|uniref:Uncharacterized protein n=1 Tax=Amycolatopsis acidiphila TaxID=715473 RepID=A0A558A5P3_9PSEU|nr:hypothetical protein FNH06_23680 [Amycolatopsis acidiphila]GHG82158.1 hypothetical protein GCM10017788_52480 [Amycolatopsis acidiphila]